MMTTTYNLNLDNSQQERVHHGKSIYCLTKLPNIVFGQGVEIDTSIR